MRPCPPWLIRDAGASEAHAGRQKDNGEEFDWRNGTRTMRCETNSRDSGSRYYESMGNVDKKCKQE